MRTRITCCKNGMLRDEEVRPLRWTGWISPAVYFGYRESIWSATAAWTTTTRWSSPCGFSAGIPISWPTSRANTCLCVDEAQDTSKIQHAILACWLSRNLFMVGTRIKHLRLPGGLAPGMIRFRQIYPEEVLLME